VLVPIGRSVCPYTFYDVCNTNSRNMLIGLFNYTPSQLTAVQIIFI